MLRTFLPRNGATLPALRTLHGHQRLATRLLSSQPPKSIAVIGGGIAGLSATYFLQKLLPETRITLFEATGKPGGWVSSKTVSTTDGNHVLFEEGPRSLRPAGLPGLNVLDLIRQLGIEDKMILVPKSAPSAKNRFIYFAGKVHKLPSSLLGFLKFAMTNPILKGSLTSLMREPFRRRPKGITDETIASFISRRFSPIMAQNMLSAVIHGIYSGSVDKLSVRSTLKALWEYETKAGSVLAGLLRGVDTRSVKDQNLQKALQDQHPDIVNRMRDISVYSFTDGLSTLTNALVTALQRMPMVTMQPNECTAVERKADGTFELSIQVARSVESFDQVVSAVRAKDTSKLLARSHNLEELDAVTYSTVMVINFHYRDPDILPINGFGYLIPKSVPLEENPDRALGVVFDSSSVPGQDTTDGTKVTCIMGGHWWGDGPVPSEQEGFEATKRVMKMHLGIDQEPEFWNAKIQRDCIPQYTVGHMARMKTLHHKLEQDWPGLGLIGSSYGGVSLNDCVLHARKIAMTIADEGRATGLEDFKDVD
ncbi:Protoporphyrinogen oxidase [Taphrina deformans PYCC 5710]|uniref:Protoporphyrinogen oxidase n=1 Tax=Taphrina deformans (strain PYCC 5710 / ATCC 11124 / CBS 356.35 / IMI 108563 / JCM 9778 / NBRC 8474) TaxID=1097556 RepID=R4XC47_TAPDE|nr:Protoporphyrinogen oxidase [Taphrina deformans PYCC 5710]|eukprot:CCG83396.1 Protoporphyrinogen oxidase [Taphrina deformans PYCC 5710]